MLRTSTKGAIYINMGRKPYGIGMRKMLALKERHKTSHDLCRTFGAIFRYALDTLGYHPLLGYAAPLVLNNFSLRNIS